MILLVLGILLLVVPIAELAVIIQVAGVIGGWNTIALLILESLLGAWLLKRQGSGILRRIDEQLRAAKLPGKELVDGFLILVAGILLLTPGFITDFFGFLLLVPPVRAGVRSLVLARFQKRLGRGFSWLTMGADGTTTRGWTSTTGTASSPTGTTRVWVDSVRVDPQPPGAGTAPRQLPPGAQG